MNIAARIKDTKYTPFLCRPLKTYDIKDLEDAISKDATFILQTDGKNKIALSWWVSSKRTRSYPYARVYDSLDFMGKKVTIIPATKDEGAEGDRDFLQWDTISLMRLLDIYVIISYYKTAKPSERYKNKITKQRFAIEQIKKEITNLSSYHSSALHWNIAQIDKLAEISNNALKSYDEIASKLKIVMHNRDGAEKRIAEIKKSKDAFMRLSRQLAESAQKRESATTQVKELVDGTKATITISNYVGGFYFFTCDEVRIKGNSIFLIDAKNTTRGHLPSLSDIKDALLKMVLFSNLKNVEIDGNHYNPIATIKLTGNDVIKRSSLSGGEKEMFERLIREAKTNSFKILLNNTVIV